MRYPASEKLELVRLVEESHPSTRLTLAKLGIPRTTFYRWYDRYLQRGKAGLQDQSPKPKHVWNRIPDEVRRRVVDLALERTELSPIEVAAHFYGRFDTLDSFNEYSVSGGCDDRRTPALARLSHGVAADIASFHQSMLGGQQYPRCHKCRPGYPKGSDLRFGCTWGCHGALVDISNCMVVRASFVRYDYRVKIMDTKGKAQQRMDT